MSARQVVCIKKHRFKTKDLFSHDRIDKSWSRQLWICAREQLEALEDETVLLGQPVDAVIALSHPPARTPQSIRLQDSGSKSRKYIRVKYGVRSPKFI
jgi:hypothetical protein